jgi:hypothetical protein
MSAKVGANEKALRAQREAAAAEVKRSPLEVREDGIRHSIGRVKTGWADLGEHFKAIRDGRLYKDTHSNFDEYCTERWGFNRSAVDRHIAGYNIVAGLLAAKVTPIGVNTEDVVALPQNEAQAREVAKAPPEERAEIMRQAADRTGGEPTAKAIREVVEERKPEKRKPNDAALAFSGRLSRLEDVGALDPVVMAANISQQTADLCERMGRWLITVADAHRERRAA